MVLSKKQKEYLFKGIFTVKDLIKIFDTNDIGWLVKQKVKVEDDLNGWKKVFMNGIEYTSINCERNPGWWTILTNIEDFSNCQWCGEWFEKDELIIYHRFRLCDQCKRYLRSRGE